MSHLNVVFDSGAPRRYRARPTRFSQSGSPKVCGGCAKPFPMRDGHHQAQVGQDGRLYCHDGSLACTLMAVRPAA
jgi:hypothetical protein